MNMKPTRFITPLLGSIALLLLPKLATATDFIKLQNNTALNLAGAWSSVGDGDGLADGDDILLWNSTYTTPGIATTLSQLSGDLSVLGLKVTNVGGALNAATTMVGFQNTTSANTLTIGASGIDLSAATQTLMIQSKITIGASQNWVVNNSNTNGNPATFNNGEDLAFQAFSGTATTATTAFNLGGNAVTTSGTGQVTITSGYAMTNGTINIGNSFFLIGGGTSRLTTVGADVNLNVAGGAVLQFQSNSAAVTSAANIGLNGGTLRLTNNNATNQVTITGTTTVNSASTINVGNNFANGSVASTPGVIFNANLAGSAALAVTNTASTASVLLMGGNNSAYSGTVSLSGTALRVFRLTSAAAGSSAATWSVGTGVILQTAGVSVNLGTLNGAGTVNNSTGSGVLSVGAGTFSGTLADGTGTLALTKTGTGTLTLTGTTSTNTGATTVQNGTLLVSPGALSGTVVTVSSGATYGAQASVSGTLNTNVSVTGGGTMLTRPLAAGATITVPALASAATGVLTFDTGVLTFSQPNQIADTTTVTYDKTINNGNLTFNQVETIGALTILNGNDTGAQVLSNTASFGFQVAGLVTVGNTGVYSVASNSSAGVGGLSLSGTATMRVSANSNPSTLNVGLLGIAGSGGTIQIGQGVGAFDAVLNLGGDVTTTGNLAFTDGGFTGGNLRQLNLGASNRAFTIAAGTTTTSAPDIAGTGGIIKAGNGTLQLTAASASNYTGPTVVVAGTFLTTPAQTAGSVIVGGGATFGVNLATAGTTLSATDLNTAATSVLQLATGALGNPIAAVMNAGAFTVDGATTIRLTGTALPLIGYSSLAGVAGFGGLSVSLPSRIAGTLVNNLVDSRVDINLSVEQAKWNGSVNGNWDIDPDGTGGTGTANWLTTVAFTPTRYFQGPPITTDTANFDDSATGTRTVTLTTGSRQSRPS